LKCNGTNVTDHPNPAPIACTLDAGASGERAQEWRELLADAQLSACSTTTGMRLTLRSDAYVRRELERLVAAEAACCPFLGLHVAQTATSLVLSVDAPPEAAAICEELFTQNSTRP
jgi:MerR family copper efflux transcriptional regulator